MSTTPRVDGSGVELAAWNYFQSVKYRKPER
jgi:hypothetical protein